MDLASEPGIKAPYWFVTVKKANSVAPKPAALARHVSSTRSSGWLGSAWKGVDCYARACDFLPDMELARSAASRLLIGRHLDGDAALMQLMSTEDADEGVRLLREQADAQEEVILPGLSVQAVDGVIVALGKLPDAMTTTLRTAIHDGVRRRIGCMSVPLACNACFPRFSRSGVCCE